MHFVVLLPDGYVLGNLAYSAYFVAAWVALAALPRWLYRAPWLNRFDQFMIIVQPLVALGFLVSFMATRVTAVVLAAPFLFAVYCVFAWLRSRWGILRGARRLNSRELALKRKQPYSPDPENSVTAIAIDGLLGGE
ncbi:hypothetical protein JT358_12790 [Micrococcales bacterium 31B]|nr:hypothetical protein [Micrococcales bacterium 31B]